MTTPTSKSVLVLRGSLPSVAVAPASLALRDDLVARLRAVPRVKDAASLDVAAEAAKAATAWLREVEAARKAVKAPFADAAKAVDALAGEAVEPLAGELQRVREAIDAHVRAEAARRAREEEERRREAARIEAERERAAREAEEARERALARARTDAAREKAEAKAAQALADAAAEAALAHADLAVAATPAAKPSGLTERREPRFEVLDAHAAYAARPDLFELTPKTAFIKACIRNGTQAVPGLRIWWETTTALKA